MTVVDHRRGPSPGMLLRAAGLAGLVLFGTACGGGRDPIGEPAPAPEGGSPTATSDTTAPAAGGGSAGCGPSQASDPVEPGSSDPASELPPVEPSPGATGVEEGQTPPNSTSC